MSWAVEEYSEDAVLAYLNSKLQTGLLKPYVAWTNEDRKYPCFVVHCGETDNVTDEFTGHRQAAIDVAVMSQAVASGGVSARNRNRVFRDAVITALAQTKLYNDINALAPTGVVFSKARIGRITRAVETDQRVFVSEITIISTVSPKEV